MGFREELTGICDAIPGAYLVTLMDRDGIAVDTVNVASSEVDLNAYLVELTGVFGQVKRASEQLATGAVAELIVHTEHMWTVLRPVSTEYFLALALAPNSNTGKARYLLRVASPKLLRELSA